MSAWRIRFMDTSNIWIPAPWFHLQCIFRTLVNAPYRARIDSYFDYACSWAAADATMVEWLQINLLQVYSVGGILIKKRCDADQYTTAVTVKTAEDDLQWQDVIVNQDLLYTGDEANLWFSQIYTTPVWRVYVTAYYEHPAMQCDLKGLNNNWCNEVSFLIY